MSSENSTTYAREIMVWPFATAPSWYQELSGLGGGELFVAFLAANHDHTPLADALMEMAPRVEVHSLPAGSILLIGGN